MMRVRPTEIAFLAGVIALTSAPMFGCVAVDGGAVEFRWVLRDRAGEPLECDQTPIASVRLVLSGQDANNKNHNPCVDKAYCEPHCDTHIGTTEFAIPPGRYQMQLQPLDAQKRALKLTDGVDVAAAVLREVSHGEVTDLNVHLIVVGQ